MGWSSRARLARAALVVVLVLCAGRARADAIADRLGELERRAAELGRERAQILRRRDEARRGMAAAEQAIAAERARVEAGGGAAERAVLESTLARARELAVTLRLLDGASKSLGDDEAAVTRQRIAVTDEWIVRAQRELDRDAASLDGGVLRDRLAHVAELRRRRDALAATLPAGSVHRGADLAAIVADASESSDALAEKADLVDSFARGWRNERDDVQRRLAQSRQELDLVRRLTALMEVRRRGRIGASDPFAADVEGFALKERERQLTTAIAATELRMRELNGWIQDAERRRAELLQVSARKVQP